MSRRGLFGLIGAGAVVVAGGGFFGVRALLGGDGADPDLDPLPAAAQNTGGITTEDVNSLVDALNTALTKRDKAGFVARYAPGAVATQAGRMFDNVGKFTFDKLEYQVIGQGGRLFSSGKGSSTVNMDIALVHQVRGVDATPMAEWYQWSLSRSGAGAPLVISAVSGAAAVMGEAKYVYYPAIWDSPNDIVVINRPNVVMAAETAAEADVLNRHADEIAKAIVDNRTLWRQAGGPTKGLAPGAFVVGTKNRDKFYYWYSGAANKQGNEAAFTIGMRNAAAAASTNDPGALGSRIVADLTADYFTRDVDEDVPRTLFRHEDIHNLTFSIMTAQVDTVPRWAIEGFADFIATREYKNPVQNYLQLDDMKRYVKVGSKGQKWDGKSFPDDTDIYDSDIVVSNGCYGLSTMIFYFIEQKYSLNKAMALAVGNYQALGAADQSTIDDPGTVVSRVLGISLSELQTQWVDFVHQVVGA